MLKLYRSVKGEVEYWETWDNDEKSGTVHWGKLGERGSDKIFVTDKSHDFHEKIQEEVTQRVQEGFGPIDQDELLTLLIEFKVDGMGNSEDLEKRSRLESRMNETLGWVALGHCDGGSIGSGTMEVCCLVVDFEIAKSIIENDLAGSEFSNYTRIVMEP
jgi:hypothetical protein